MRSRVLIAISVFLSRMASYAAHADPGLKKLMGDHCSGSSSAQRIHRARVRSPKTKVEKRFFEALNGRVMSKEKFTTQVTIRLTAEDYQAFQKKAAQHGMTPATYLRVCALRAMRAEPAE